MFKKILGAMLSFALAVTAISYTPATVKADDNISYSYDSSTNTLTFSGTGELTAEYVMMECLFYVRSTQHIIINEGITSIGNEAFMQFTATSLSLPSTLESIGENAFSNCSNLSSIVFSGTSLSTLGAYAFSGCAFTNVVLPDNLSYIGNYCFRNCPLQEITIQTGCDYVGSQSIPSGCTIKGYTGSKAEEYASFNRLTFISLGIEAYLHMDGFMLDAEIENVRTIFSSNISSDNITAVGVLTSYAKLSQSIMVYDTDSTKVTKYSISPNESDRSLARVSQHLNGSWYKFDRALTANTSYASQMYLRAYIILDNNQVVYTPISSYSINSLATELYYNHPETLYSKYIYDNLYTKVLSKNNGIEVPFPANKTYYSSDSYYEDELLYVDGFQFSYTNHGLRTVFTIDQNVDYTECGLIIGINNVDSSLQNEDVDPDEDMIINSPSDYVISYKSTCAGLAPVNMSSVLPEGDSYAMTFPLKGEINELCSTMYFRAYAKLSDGTYIYSQVVSQSMNLLALNLYREKAVNDLNSYNYLFNSILTIVDPDEASIPFQWYYPI